MAPTFLLINDLRFYIQSNEEARKHIHIEDNSNRKAKFWLEPEIEIAANYGFKENKITQIKKIIIHYEAEFKRRWEEHFC